VQGRSLTILRALWSVAEADADTAVDQSTGIRLMLWRAAYDAFSEAPLLGHGWARLMSAVAPHVPAEHQEILWLPSLHNDVANFAVAAGIVGIGVYLLLLATPLVAALYSPRDRLYAARLYGVTVLVISYGCAGLTDLMFGFEFHTAIYICLSAILLGYCRAPAPSGSVSTPATQTGV
jgi:O-antigen ligase